MKISSGCLFVLSFLLSLGSLAQELRPGFDKGECLELLKIGARFGDSAYYMNLPAPQRFRHVYRSAVVGLENRWDLWTDGNQAAVISLRGTTTSAVSWLVNFYAAMVPAKGTLQFSDTDRFDYELASDPRAAVHVGWLVSMAYLSRDILPRIDSCYKSGIKQFILTGHSQGGAICFLLTSYLYHLQKLHLLPADIRFKSYCFAGPKPGNLYYAYDYEEMTQYGWAYNVVNSADWVPESPFSIQTTNDFNATNPFVNAKDMIGKMGFPKNLVLKHVYNRLDRPTRRAQRRFQRILGKMTYKLVRKTLPGFRAPVYYNSNNYVRTGNTIVLKADEDYYKLFPDDKNQIFRHHLHPPYLYLASKLPDTPAPR